MSICDLDVYEEGYTLFGPLCIPGCTKMRPEGPSMLNDTRPWIGDDSLI